MMKKTRPLDGPRSCVSKDSLLETDHEPGRNTHVLARSNTREAVVQPVELRYAPGKRPAASVHAATKVGREAIDAASTARQSCATNENVGERLHHRKVSVNLRAEGVGAVVDARVVDLAEVSGNPQKTSDIAGKRAVPAVPICATFGPCELVAAKNLSLRRCLSSNRTSKQSRQAQ